MNLNMFIPEIQILEKIVRPLIVYFFLLIAFRLAGKRELGQMTPFDLVVKTRAKVDLRFDVAQ